MNTAIKFFTLIGASAFLASCANYGYISENDVYMQAPTEMNLNEDEDDITSFNAFKAKQKGAFEQEYQDPRINQRVRANQIMIINSYGPYYGSYRNGPLAFHGMGYSPYGYEYRGFNSGLGFGISYGWGNHFYHNQMDPFGYGFGYGGYGGHYGNGYYGNNYYGGGYYGGHYGNGYYNGYNNGYYNGFNNGYYNGNNNINNSASNNQATYNGHRGSTSSSSNRSSYYNTTKSLQGKNVTSDVNNQANGNSRRDVQKRSAGANDYSEKFNQNGIRVNKGAVNTSRNVNSTPVHNRVVNNSYTPNTSARRSGVVQERRQSNVTVQPNRSSGNARSTSTQRNSGTISPQSTRTPTPRVQQSTTRPSSFSTSPSSSGSSRSSSPSSTPSSTSRRR